MAKVHPSPFRVRVIISPGAKSSDAKRAQSKAKRQRSTPFGRKTR